MPTGTSNPKIDELRARLKADPRSRLFFPLAEELRKQGELDEAERVLRDGLSHHEGYVSALISLGRVLHELGRHDEASSTLDRALGLDPGNVVAARLLADAYLASGDRIEALKKYKLASALLPADEDLAEKIERVQRELADTPRPSEGPRVPSEAAPVADVADEVTLEGDSLQVPVAAVHDSPLLTVASGEDEIVEAVDPAGQQLSVVSAEEVFDTDPEQTESADLWLASNDPAARSGGEVVEGPWHDQESAPAEVAVDAPAQPAESAPSELTPEQTAQVPASAATSSPIETLTMGDLYAQQGHIEAAREIYSKILERHPGNTEVREKLEQLPEEGAAAQRERVIRRLESWLGRMTREASRV